MFKIEDTQTLGFEITYDEVTPESWRGLKSIERGKFLSGSIKSDMMFGSDAAMLTLSGDEFGIFVFQDRIMLMAHTMRQGSDLPVPRKKPLSKDILRNMSADFNMVVGIVLGALQVSVDETTFEIKIGLQKDKAVYGDRTVGKTIGDGIQSKLGSGRVEAAAIKFATTETFMEKPARAAYDLDRRFSPDGSVREAAFSGQMRFGNTGPQDLQDITVKYIDRINEVIGELVKGVKATE